MSRVGPSGRASQYAPRSYRAACLLVALLAAASGCAQLPVAMHTVIVDTDAGADDLIALAFLLASPQVRIEAISIGPGLAHLDAGGANVLRLLELAGRRDVPVYLGRATPLAGDRQFPSEWRRRSDELAGVTLPPAQRSPEPRAASDYLAARLSDAARPVSVLALGGLTNLAVAFSANPAAVEGIRTLVIMGGAIGVPGNLADAGPAANRTAEWNFYIDAEAAQVVFASGAPIYLIPLDATVQVPIDHEFVRAVQRAADTPLARAVTQLIATAGDAIQAGTYFAWDPLAAAALVEPSVVQFTPTAVEVGQHPPEVGRAVAVPEATPNAYVAFAADAARFRELFITTLASRGR